MSESRIWPVRLKFKDFIIIFILGFLLGILTAAIGSDPEFVIFSPIIAIFRPLYDEEKILLIQICLSLVFTIGLLIFLIKKRNSFVIDIGKRTILVFILAIGAGFLLGFSARYSTLNTWMGNNKLPLGCPPKCQGIDMLDAWLYEANFKGANLAYANLENAELDYADFRNADLRNANLLNARMEFIDFRGADLRGANLLGEANESGYHMFKPYLKGAIIDDSTLLETYDRLNWEIVNSQNQCVTLQDMIEIHSIRFYSVNISGINLFECDLSSLDLFQIELIDVDLRNANLIDADLRSAEFDGVQMEGANLSGADLRGADFSKVSRDVLLSLNLNNAVYSEYTKWPSDFKPSPESIYTECREFIPLEECAEQ